MRRPLHGRRAISILLGSLVAVAAVAFVLGRPAAELDRGPGIPPAVPSDARGACGVPGLSIVTDVPGCRMDVVNRKPGQAAVEQVTVANTSGRRYVLYLRAGGTPTAFWGDLRLGVWKTGTATPGPLPPLRFWTRGFQRLTTLDPGDSIRYTIELYLPLPAGNSAQRQTAEIDFSWRAQAG